MHNLKLYISITFIFQFVSSKTGLNQEKEKHITTDVVIIGAGASGISAARTLHDANIDFVVLEADQKIGGRIQNQQFGKYVIENGANWIHGPYTEDNPPINNPIWNFKNKYDMKGSTTNWDDQTRMRLDGNNVPESEMEKWWDILQDAKSFCLQMGKYLLKTNKNDKMENQESIDISLDDCFNEFGYGSNYTTSLDESIGEFIKWWDFYADVTIPAKNMSLMLWAGEQLDDADYIDEDFFITDQRGYNVFLHEISKNFKDSIKLGHHVTHINHDDSGVDIRVTTNESTNNIKPSLSKILKIHAKYVILTVPLGVLQKESINFDPPLPGKKIESIRRMKMGNYAKVYLRFPYNFWGDKETLIILREPVGLIQQALNLDHKKYFPGSNMITLHFVGDKAVYIESQAIETTKSVLMEELQKFFATTIPWPDEIHVTNWTHNPFSYGSYSALSLGLTSDMRRELNRNVGNIHFSGEHTHPQYSATVHGAFEAGENTAHDVIRTIQNAPNPSSGTQLPFKQSIELHTFILYCVYISYLRI